jgi:DNA (cytosine-5)-methyltransferase 1
LVSTSHLVERRIALRNGESHITRFPHIVSSPAKARDHAIAAVADAAFLRSSEWPEIDALAPAVRSADLFSGCGLMTLGAWEGCRAIGKRLQPVVAFDFNKIAGSVYQHNFPDASVITEPIETILTGALGSKSTLVEREFARRTGPIHLLLAGPPCQGHSDLNNHTRRDDPKNRLYARVARFAELFEPTHIIVENVSAVLHDRGDVLNTTIAALMRLGYAVDHATVDLASVGVAQRRRRHVLLASLTRSPNIKATVSRYWRPVRPVSWAIGDLGRCHATGVFDQAAQPTERNQKRIDYLFRHDRYDLPDHVRPDCHKLKKHSYKSVYGRMDWNAPAPTITSGFGCMGQGRYVHPRKKRTLTPHEAARIQFIPDFFRFPEKLKRTALAEMIGNAVPPKLTYMLVVELLR